MHMEGPKPGFCPGLRFDANATRLIRQAPPKTPYLAMILTKSRPAPKNKAGFAEILSDSLAALAHQPHGTLQPTSNVFAMLRLVLLALPPQIGAFYL
jgi:hypothetical protein